MSTLPEHEIVPDTHLVQSLCTNNLDWRRALGELIDNAFDAGASSVSISFGTRKGASTFTITDNGNGCEDPRAFVRFGGHSRKASTRLGRYGIGAKEAVMWIGQEPPRVVVVSTHAGKRRTLAHDWKVVVNTNRWTIDPSSLTVIDAAPGECGTRLTVTPSQRCVPSGKGWDALLSTLGYLYAPAIKRGKQINVQRDSGPLTPIVGYALPALEPGHIDTVIDVGGRKARVLVGIVPPGVANERPGLTYTYGFRVILEASGYGCGGFDHSRIAGIVDLGDGWVLAKNKDNVSQHREDLFAAVFAACRPILERAEVTGQQLESAEFSRLTDRLFNDWVFGPADAKAVRGKGEEHGTKAPTGRGGKHKRAEREQDGETFARVARGSLRIVYTDGDPDHAGRFSPPSTVMLHRRHPCVAAIQAGRNALAAVILATSLLSSRELTGEQLVLRRVLPETSGGPQERFEALMSRCLRGVRLDGRNVVASSSARELSPPASGDAAGSA